MPPLSLKHTVSKKGNSVLPQTETWTTLGPSLGTIHF